MANEPKDYAPINAKQVQTKFGTMLKLSFNADKLVEWLQTRRNEKGWVNLNVNERRETGKYGETHSVSLDTWKPDGSPKPRQNSNTSQQGASGDEVPF